jgi:hypothetical protein
VGIGEGGIGAVGIGEGGTSVGIGESDGIGEGGIGAVGIGEGGTSVGISEGGASVGFGEAGGEAGFRGFSKSLRSIIDERQQCSTAIIGSNVLSYS